MFNSKRKVWITLSFALVALLLASLLAACGPVPVLIPIPVSSNGEPVVIVLATATPATGQAAEAAAGAAATDEEEAAVALLAEDGPGAIPHKYEKREECTECHEAGEGDEASPADHAGYTDDLCLFCHAPREDDVARPTLPEDASVEFCLPCHGPYADLMAQTEGLVEDFDGVTANPHMYSPHDSDKIISCKNCHEVHDLPVADPAAIPQADGDYCFAACHHEETFEPCADCHEEGGAGGGE